MSNTVLVSDSKARAVEGAVGRHRRRADVAVGKIGIGAGAPAGDEVVDFDAAVGEVFVQARADAERFAPAGSPPARRGGR